ncbi:MAG: undecaprenyl-diphosphate phosphatase [Thiotrichales bacterium]|nr:undecaprenyl-diphosphate phosphatase [Thiotrichales bacterium]
MEWLQVLVLAAVQGLTEFLPVSSSAHLVLVPVLTGWPDQGLAFDVAVHVGSLAAVLIYFRRDFLSMLRDGWHGPREPGGRVRLGWLVAIATVPVGAVGLAVDANLADSLRDPLVIAVATIGFGLALLFAAGAGAKDRDIESIGVRDAIVIGCAQAIALVPGTSRAGITMTAGLLVGLTPAASARFSFLLSAPVILIAGAWKTFQLAAGAGHADWSALVAGALVAALCAYVCIHAFLRFIARIGFAPFVAYRLVLGTVLLWVFT